MTKFGVGDFSSTEPSGQLDGIAFLEEFTRIFELYIDVVLANLEAHANLLNLSLFLILAILGILLGLLVTIFAPVDDFHHGWGSARRNLGQIKTCFLSNEFGLVE